MNFRRKLQLCIGITVLVASAATAVVYHETLSRPGDPRAQELRVERLRITVVGATLFSTMFSLVLLSLVISSLLRRLDAMRLALGKLGADALESKLPVDGNDEISQVARSFNAMASSLGEARAKLIDQHRALGQSSKMSALGELATGVAHEINNPLTILLGKASQVRRAVQSERPDREYLLSAVDKIEHTVIRIARIVKALQTITDHAESEPVVETSLPSVIEGALTLCRERFLQSEVELRLGDLPEGCVLQGQVQRLSQVLFCLLNNAREAVQDSSERRWVELAAKNEGEHVVLMVTDSGHGLPAWVQQRLFQPFFSTKQGSQSTGLGLSVSREIIASHHGTLELDETCPNTRFVVRLPRHQPVSSAPGAAA